MASKLTDIHRAFIVKKLACFMTPTAVAKALLDEHGVTITVQSVQGYDPHTHAGRRLSKGWREVFSVARKAFLDHIEDHIPEANKAVRVAGLAKGAQHFEQRGNYMAMAEMYEKIAKELGNVHTNRRELTGKNGGPMQYEDVGAMTDDEAKAELVRLLKKPEPTAVKPS